MMKGSILVSQVGLGHRRLSIIDLNSGHQPLSNEDGTVWIVFNGEIYNYRELRTLLLSKGHVFKTQTDTEVIVHLYEEFGPQCLEKLRGMFAFAIWDENDEDPLPGEGPGWNKAPLLLHDRRLLGLRLRDQGDSGGPCCASRDRARGHRQVLDFLVSARRGDAAQRDLQAGSGTLSDWLRTAERKYGNTGIFGSRSLRVSQAFRRRRTSLKALLAETVELHMIADVPVGVLLSGGVDSTAVLSFAAERTEKEINSYTVGFSDPGVADERPYAKLAAEAFGSRHHDMTISAADFADFMPQYVWHMEEPVCEPPAIAMYYVSKLAKNYVKVLLSGEGGDEAFAGYSNYRNLLWLERVKQALSPLNGAAAWGLSLANSYLQSPRVAKYRALNEGPVPRLLLQPHLKPVPLLGNGLGKLYSTDFAHSIDREHSLEPMRRLQAHVRGQNTLDAMLYIDTKTGCPTTC